VVTGPGEAAPSLPTERHEIVQFDCGLVRTEGLAPRSTEGKVARKDGIARKEEFVSEGRVLDG
jgi:hypothetical protein